MDRAWIEHRSSAGDDPIEAVGWERRANEASVGNGVQPNRLRPTIPTTGYDRSLLSYYSNRATVRWAGSLMLGDHCRLLRDAESDSTADDVECDTNPAIAVNTSGRTL